MMRSVFIGFFLMIIHGQILGQEERELYYAWLDSVQNEGYTMSRVVHLDEVVITDTAQNNFLNNPKNRANHRNIDQMLHTMPGLHMVRRGNFAAEPMLRGLTSERYVTTIDGMRVFSACTDKMDPITSYIEPINLRSIETTFGSQGNMAGGSTGGSVSFGLKKPIFNRERPVTSTVNFGYSSVSQGFDQAIDLNYSLPKVALRISGVHRKSGNYMDGNGDEVKYSQFEKFNYAGALSYRLTDRHMITFDYLGDDALDVGYPALPMDVSSARARMFGFTLLIPKMGWLDDPEIKVYHNYIKHVMDDTKRDSLAMHMDMPGQTKTSGLYIKGMLFEKETSWIKAKADFYNTYAHAEMTMYPNEKGQLPMFMLTWPDVRRSIGGLEFQYGRILRNMWRISSSFRIENTSSFVDNTFGERQLSIFDKTGQNRSELLKNISFTIGKNRSKITVAYGERIASVSEQFGFYLFNRQDGFDYLGDPDLNKESNLQIDISQAWNTSLFDLRVNVFTYFFSDFITGIYDPSLSAMTIGAKGVKWYRNISSARMHGGEAVYQLKFTKSFEVNGDIKYVYGVDHADQPLPQQPPLKISTSLIKEIRGWSVQPEFEYAAIQTRINNSFLESKTDAFKLFNLRWSKSIQSAKFDYRFGGGIENITNEVYREHTDISTILRNGRNLYLQFSMKF